MATATTSTSWGDTQLTPQNVWLLARSGELDLAAELAISSLQSGEPDPVVRAQLAILQASILLMTGHPTESLAAAESILPNAALADELVSNRELALLRGLTTLGDNDRAWRHFGRIMAGPAAEGALPGALAAAASLAWADGRVAEAVEFCRSAIDRADRTGNRVISTRSRLQLSTMLTSLGEFVEAAQLLPVAAEQAEQHDVASLGPVKLIGARLDLATGSLEQAAERAHEGLAHVERFGARLYAPIGHSVLASVAILCDRSDEAFAHLARCSGTSAPAIGVLGWGGCIWAEARHVEAQHGPRAALSVIDAVATSPANVNRLLLEDPSAAAWWVRCALGEGDRWTAAAVVASAQVLSQTNAAFGALAAGEAHARGVFWRDAEALEKAAAAYPQPWAAGSAAEDAAAVLSSDPVRSARQLARALAAYERAGATRDARRVEARGHTAPSRQRRRHRGRPVSGWASLTETEHRISLLVAEGLTNAKAAEQMYLSRHTVDFHLRQIYRKLNINSRVELTRLLVLHDAGEASGPLGLPSFVDGITRP